MKIKQRILHFQVLALLAGMFFTACSGPRTYDHYRQFYSSRLNAKCSIMQFPDLKSQNARVLFIAEVKYSDLKFIRSDSQFVSFVSVSGAIHPKEEPEHVRLFDKKEKIVLEKYETTRAQNRYVQFFENIDLPAGEYFAQIQVADQQASQLYIFEKELKIKEFDQFHVSDIVLVKDSLTYPDSKHIFPFSDGAIRDSVYSHFWITGLNRDDSINIDLDILDFSNKIVSGRTLTKVAENSLQPVWIKLQPDDFVLGISRIRVIARHNGHEDSSKVVHYSHFNFSADKMQNFNFLIEPLKLIMPRREWNKLKDAEADTQNAAFKKFWEKRNPDPNSETNPLLEEFFYRVEEANKLFKHGLSEGWETDRGRIYLIYGQPDSINRHRSQSQTTVYEIWTYRELGLTFYFKDDFNSGEFRLMNNIHR